MEEIRVQKNDWEPTRIYSMDELDRMEPTEELTEQLYHSDDLFISMVVDMWRFCGYGGTTREILDECQTNPNWFRDRTWTKEQKKEFGEKFAGYFVKLLGMEPDEAEHEMEIWSAFGGAFREAEPERRNAEN